MPATKQQSILAKSYEGLTYSDVAEDYNLPDYLPDISRLLQITADITDHSYDYTGSSVPYQIKVQFHFLYSTADGKLCHTEFEREITGQTPVGGADTDDMITLDSTVETVTCRLVNSRKLTVKCKLRHAVTAYRMTDVTPTIEGGTEEDEKDIESLTATALHLVTATVSEKGTPVSEDTEIDSALPSIREIVNVEMTPYMTDIRTENGKLSYKGEIATATLYLADVDGDIPTYVTAYGKIPLYGDIYDEEIRENQVAKGEFSVHTPEFRPQTNAFGENRTVETDFTYDTEVTLYENEEAVLTKDAYSTVYPVETHTADLAFSSVLAAKSFHFSSEGSFALDDPDFDKVTSVSASTHVTHAEKQGNKLHFDGLMTVCLILTDKKGGYLSRIFDYPTSGECDATGLPDNFSVQTACAVPEILTKVQDGKLTCHAESFISYTLFENHKESYIDSILLCTDEKTENRTKTSLTICYPAKNDTLFSVGKRYQVAVSDILLHNEVGETLPNLLIIPKKKEKPSRIV